MRILIYDLETVPTLGYVWSAWKQNMAPVQVEEHGRLVCWAAKWVGDKKVHFGAEWKSDTFVEDLLEMMDEADAIVTYNGDKFDRRVFNTALVKRGLYPPAPSKSIDMYKVVKRQFSTFHARMDTVAELLGVEGKLDTGGFELWRGVMAYEKKALKKMEQYNRKDILVLEEIYERLKGWIPNHPTDSDGGSTCCPNCGGTTLQRRGYHRTKVSKFQRYQCQECGSWHRGRTNLLSAKDRTAPEIVSL